MKAIVLLLALAAGCGTIKPKPDPGPVCIDHDCTCADVCAHAAAMACDWAAPTDAGHSCLEVCRNAIDPQGPIRWDLSCRAHADSCELPGCM